MKADNGVSFIQDVKQNGDYRSVHFDLILSEENMMAAQAEGFLKKFELTTTIATSSMHLLDKKNMPKNYATAEEILEEFFHLRLEYYEKRKEIMLKNLESELLKLDNKVKFILRVLREEREMSKMNDAEFVQELRRRGFPPFPKMAKLVEAAVAGATDGAEESEESSVAPAPSSPLIPDSNYDYILAIRSLTIEKEIAKELTGERDQVRKAVEELKIATPRSLWRRDLDAFEKELDKLDEKTKKASESVTTVASNSAMDTDNNVGEVVKPEGRQGAKKKQEVEEDDMLDLAQRLAQYNFGSAPADSSKTTETSKAISLGDDDDDAAARRKRGKQPLNKEEESSENAAGNSSLEGIWV